METEEEKRRLEQKRVRNKKYYHSGKGKERQKNGTELDLSTFKGEFTYNNIEEHFGKEIADKIMESNPYYKQSKAICAWIDKLDENDPTS